MERSAVSATLSIDQALREASNQLAASDVSTAVQDAHLLLLPVVGIDRAGLIAHPERILSAEQLEEYRQLIGRRAHHEPIQYITGEREFYGLRLKVTPDVLIPRPETEHLVEAALERIPANGSLAIADIGTGSGAVAVAIAHCRPMAQITALDISVAALDVARRNASYHNVAGSIRFVESDLLQAVAGERFDMIVSNPPYIADSERGVLDEEVRDYEPEVALFSGPTGLEIYPRIIRQAVGALRPGGWLLLEMGAGQHLELRQLLKSWNDVSFVPDLQSILRVAVAQRP